MLEKDRTTWTGSGVDEILAIDYWGNLKRKFSESGTDVINAVYRIDAVDRSLQFDYWLSTFFFLPNPDIEKVDIADRPDLERFF